MILLFCDSPSTGFHFLTSWRGSNDLGWDEICVKALALYHWQAWLAWVGLWEVPKSCGPVKAHFGSPFFWVKYWEDGGFKLGGGFRYFFFHPKIGEDFQFDEHIFQMGW